MLKTNNNEQPAIGEALQSIRQSQKLSLDELSKRAGVSKSMLSQIERNVTNPTVAVLWRLASALGISITDFLVSGKDKPKANNISIIRASETPSFINTEGKTELRILGPVELAGKFEWYELIIEAGGALVSNAHEIGTKEHLTLISGSVLVKSGEIQKKLAAGETARYNVDVEHEISNIGKSMAIMLLVVEQAK